MLQNDTAAKGGLSLNKSLERVEREMIMLLGVSHEYHQGRTAPRHPKANPFNTKMLKHDIKNKGSGRTVIPVLLHTSPKYLTQVLRASTVNPPSPDTFNLSLVIKRTAPKFTYD